VTLRKIITFTMAISFLFCSNAFSTENKKELNINTLENIRVATFHNPIERAQQMQAEKARKKRAQNHLAEIEKIIKKAENTSE
jgi:hypothetical protein